MARMYPTELDRDDRQIKDAERKVFSALRDQLDDEYVVFHSAAWLGPGDNGELRDGEADFVLAHPTFGLLVLEVKGGRIGYDAHENRGRGKWHSIDRNDDRWTIKDPFDQAKRSMHALAGKNGKIKALSGWEKREFLYGYAVVFPDVSADLEVVPAQFDPAIVIDGRDMGELSQRIVAIYGAWRGSQQVKALGADGIEMLISLLAPILTMHALLGTQIGNNQAALLTLTKQQFRVLNVLRRMRKALISGCAGSGKTALAAEKASRLALNENMRVLFTCYNARLANAVRVQLGQTPGVTVGSFHELCMKFARDAGVDSHRPAGISEDAYFNEYLPEQLLSAATTAPELRFDALIVDEGQDFHADWWVALEAFLVENPIMYIFYDDNQRLFTDTSNFPFSESPLPLDVNCRNTQTIHNVVKQFYRSPDVDYVTALGPAGQAIEVQAFSTHQEEEELLGHIIQRLTTQDGVDPKHIVVQTRYTPQSLGWSDKMLGGVVLREQVRGRGQVLCCTIKSFKGMESPVVILAGLGDVAGRTDETDLEENLEALLYVAASRAMSHLIVLLPRNAARKIRKAFSSV